MTTLRRLRGHLTTSEKTALTTTGEDVGLRGVDSDAADVVVVSLKHVNLPQRVVIEHTDHHVVLVKDEN